MIVDSSALVAVIRREPGFESLLEALLTESGVLPAPVLVETRRVAAMARNEPHPGTTALLAQLATYRLRIEPFTAADADLATIANERYGTGNGRGGTLNMLDLMVYGMAKRMDRPVLCTGRDFAATDIDIHPASRRW